MRITGFEWDEGNVVHLTLGQGIEPEGAEEALAVAPFFRKSKLGHDAALGPSRSGRLMVIIFEKKAKGIVRVVTGWDLDGDERRYYLCHRGG